MALENWPKRSSLLLSIKDFWVIWFRYSPCSGNWSWLDGWSCSLHREEDKVVEEASFTNDLGADSLDTVELIMEFEREFDIQIPDDQAEKIATVGQAIQYIESSK